jgi:copper(I)-binding protein
MKSTNAKLLVRACTGVLLAASAQSFAATAKAADYDVGSIHITTPWARATAKSASVGAAYLTIANNGKTSDRVSCVSSDVSTQCQIHTMEMVNGVMKMRPVDEGLEIMPGQTIMLKPGGIHVMLSGLKHPLEPGRIAEVTLQFEQAGAVDIEFPIVAIGAAAPGATAAGDSGSMMMQGGGSMMQMNKH